MREPEASRGLLGTSSIASSKLADQTQRLIRGAEPSVSWMQAVRYSSRACDGFFEKCERASSRCTRP